MNIVHTSYTPDQSYFDGTGLYQDWYPKVLSTFPKDPCKTNTTPLQNLFAFTSAMYKAYHEDDLMPGVFINQYAKNYNLSFLPKEVRSILHQYLLDIDGIKHKLDKLLDLAIFASVFDKDINMYVIPKLVMLCVY